MSYNRLDKVNEILTIVQNNTKFCESTKSDLERLYREMFNMKFMIEKLLICCNNNNPVIDVSPKPRPLPPGEVIHPRPVLPRPKPVLPSKPVEKDVYSIPKPVVPIKEYDRASYDTPFYPHGNVISIGGTYKIVGDKYIGPDGVDLRRWLPLELNYYDVKNDVVLEAINDYRVYKIDVLSSKQPVYDVIFVYQVRNTKTKTVKTFEATAGKMKKWWDIHSSAPIDKREDFNDYGRSRKVY